MAYLTRYNYLNKYIFPALFPGQPIDNGEGSGATTLPVISKPSKEGDSDAPLLEDYDAAANNASDAEAHLQEALRHTNIEQIYRLRLAQIRKTSPLYTGSPARRGLAWLVCIGYLTLIYVVIFYFFYFITDSSLQIVSTIKLTASNVYTGLADTYQNIVDPATPQQVAELMTELYELLAEMGLYDESLIARPPHLNPTINRTLAEELNFSPKAIEMMEMLPYLDFKDNASLLNWERGSYGDEFVLRGTYADLRDEGVLSVSRDPYFVGVDANKSYNEDGGPYMGPNYVMLSLMGDWGVMMVLNVANSELYVYFPLTQANIIIVKMWTIQQFGGNVDPALENKMGESDIGNWLSPESNPSRLAREALRDYIDKFITLEWMPGGIYSGTWEGDEYVRLYRKYGWRENFDRKAFNEARRHWDETEERHREAEEPFDKVATLQRQVEICLDSITRMHGEISDIDAGNQNWREDDLPKHRQDLLTKVNEQIGHLPTLQKDLEAAREVAKSVDPVVQKMRKERIAKYGY